MHFQTISVNKKGETSCLTHVFIAQMKPSNMIATLLPFKYLMQTEKSYCAKSVIRNGFKELMDSGKVSFTKTNKDRYMIKIADEVWY